MAIRARPMAVGERHEAAGLSQENLRQARESLASAAVPIIAATPAEQKHQHDDQDDKLSRIHDLAPLGENKAGFGPEPYPFSFARCYNFTRDFIHGLHLKPALPNDERPHEHCRSDQHHAKDDVPRRMYSMPLTGEFAVVLFPFLLLVLPLLLMVFVMLLLVIHDSSLRLKRGRGNKRAIPHSERRAER